MKKIGIDFIIFNMVIVFGCAAVISGICYILTESEGDFFSICFLFALIFSEVCFFQYLENNKFTNYVVARTVKKNVIKYNFEKAHTIYANNTTLMIDTEGGRIAYVSNLNPWKFQIISTKDIDDIKNDYKNTLNPDIIHYVYFQFSYQGKVMKFATFRCTPYYAALIKTCKVQNAIKKAAAAADILRAAKQMALYDDERIEIKITYLQETDVEQETQTAETQAMETQRKEDEKKFHRAFAKWIFVIAGIILCVNVFCRMVDARKSVEYEQVMGTVTKTKTTTEWVGGRKTYRYHVYIEYQPWGYLYTYDVSEYDYFNMFSKGDTVPVLYRKDDVYEAYVAKKDWMTGAYLPISKWYNAPLIISIVLFVIGLIFYTNSPILEWYIHSAEITIGKKEIKKLIDKIIAGFKQKRNR